MHNLIENKKEELSSICKKLKIKRMDVFGSAAVGNFGQESDIDILISFSDKLSIEEYTDNYFILQYTLRELFNREVDVVTERSLSNPYFIKSINDTRELIYEG